MEIGFISADGLRRAIPIERIEFRLDAKTNPATYFIADLRGETREYPVSVHLFNEIVHRVADLQRSAKVVEPVVSLISQWTELAKATPAPTDQSGKLAHHTCWVRRAWSDGRTLSIESAVFAFGRFWDNQNHEMNDVTHWQPLPDLTPPRFDEVGHG